VPPRHLYIHVPFCARRCSYCDFAIAVRPRIPTDDYVAAIGRELAARRAAKEEPWALDSLYLGGGTPSKLGGAGVARLLDEVRQHARLAPAAEVTLEANPEDVTPDAARAWRGAGINRLSLGAQSFDDRVLAWMHRTHDAAAVRASVEAARAAGFDNLSLDLIFALPESLGRTWEGDLREAVAFAPEHLSVYGLTVEPATPLARWRDRGLLHEAPDERYEREFLTAHEMLDANGFAHYEVSNYARAGREARHNSAYWRGVPYAAVGPSAHSFEGGRRRWNLSAYAAWLAAVGAGRDPMEADEEVTPELRALEEVYLALRTARGLHLEPGEPPKLQPWLDAGWATIDATETLRLTPLGWLRLDALTEYLTGIRSPY
jgi:putative oxygen-independent coproporphyrinogen III oxidase